MTTRNATYRHILFTFSTFYLIYSKRHLLEILSTQNFYSLPPHLLGPKRHLFETSIRNVIYPKRHLLETSIRNVIYPIRHILKTTSIPNVIYSKHYLL